MLTSLLRILVELYLSLLLANSKSRVLLSLVGQSTSWVKFVMVEQRIRWLKSPDVLMKALGCCDWSYTVNKCMTSHAVVMLAKGRI